MTGQSEHDFHIDLKLKHTFRVVAMMTDVARSEGLVDVDLAKKLALLHDVGRFSQYQKYETFADILSEDHAALGVRVLKENSVLDDFSSDQRALLFWCIEQHNKLHVPEEKPARWIKYLKLVKDADKLDVYKVMIDHFSQPNFREFSSLTHNLPEITEISPAVLNTISSHTMVVADDVRSINDFMCLILAWVYDLHFPRTRQIVRERGYIQALGQHLTDEIHRQQVLESLEQFLENSLIHA